jgi:hypothetical protein
MLRGFFVAIGVVENKFMILNKLCYAINFDLRLVDLDIRIETTHSVNLPC